MPDDLEPTERRYYLTEDDRRLVQSLMDDVRGRGTTTKQRAGQEPLQHQAPEVYVGRAGAGGIPGLTTTGSDGTASDSVEISLPGVGETVAYKAVPSDTAGTGPAGDPELVPVGDKPYVVHNLGGQIDEGAWFLIHRDKSGTWWVGAGVGGNTPFVRLLEDTRWPYWTGAVLQEYDADGEFVDATGPSALVSVKPPDANVVGHAGEHWQATSTGKASPDPLPADETTGTFDDTLDEPGRPRYRLERDTNPSGCGTITSNVFTVTTDRCVAGVMTTVDTDYEIVLDLLACTMVVSVVAGTGS